MPSVGMRRSTRVFGARVLRSGRRVLTGLAEGGKYMRSINVENEWIELLENSGGGREDDGSRCKGNLWGENGNDATMEIIPAGEIEMCEHDGDMEATKEDKMYGIVYRRKRKRTESKSDAISEDMRYGKQFVRKKWRKKCRMTGMLETCGHLSYSTWCQELAVVATEFSGDSGHQLACFLNTVLSYLWRVKFGLWWLSEFVFSEPIFRAFSTHGIQFLQDSISCEKPGFCVISGSRSPIPVFAVDFSAVPFSFMLLHLSNYLRSARLDCVLVKFPFGVNSKVEKLIDCDKEYSSDTPPVRDLSVCNMVASETDDSGRRELSHSSVGFSKLAVRSIQLRNSHCIQRRRSSLKRKRGRPPSGFRVHAKGSGTVASDFFRFITTSHVHKSSPNGCCTFNVEKLKCNLMGSTQDICANSCSANILVVEKDKCYREEGAIITLEISASQHWFLAVKNDGIERYSLTAQKVMRPPCCNRFTHATIWTDHSNWKLEFPCKSDWLIFKELYKECSDRNVQAPPTSIIPVPGVREVLDPPDTGSIPFVRPDTYITVKDDELSRALVKKTANYDMDSDDEEWLNKFNTDLNVEKELHELVLPESFEMIIDAFEKGLHCNSNDCSNEKAADNFCMDGENKEFVEAVRNYWIQKQRQNRSALTRIFQLYQPRRTQVITKSVLRKKRSLKRHGNQVGRGTQSPFLRAMSAEKGALKQQNNFSKLQEAEAAANRSVDLAILMRQKAQALMETADLATYKAMIALKIAEAAKYTDLVSNDAVRSWLRAELQTSVIPLK